MRVASGTQGAASGGWPEVPCGVDLELFQEGGGLSLRCGRCRESSGPGVLGTGFQAQQCRPVAPGLG